jgi:hypothetical protein
MVLASLGSGTHDVSVPYGLVYHDLLRVQPENYPNFPTIYWLRLFREGTCCVAIVTEVPFVAGL